MMEIKDIVTLSDQNKYQIISKIDYENIYYYYLTDINDISNVKFLYENGSKLTEVEDENLVEELLPKFFYKIKDMI